MSQIKLNISNVEYYLDNIYKTHLVSNRLIITNYNSWVYNDANVLTSSVDLEKWQGTADEIAKVLADLS